MVEKLPFEIGDESFTMIYVEGGLFLMGASTKEEWGYTDSNWNWYPIGDVVPAHPVSLSDFFIGETVVTQGLWQLVMGNNPSHSIGATLPVYNVSWEDCQQFISSLNDKLRGQLPAERAFRLPTEAEWEYAARGGKYSKGSLYSGSNNLGDVAWYADNSGDSLHPVAQKQANELGLYDMSGNIREWCWDREGRYKKDFQTNPKGKTSSDIHVSRGGTWGSHEQHCRVFYRDDVNRYFVCLTGLRLAL